MHKIKTKEINTETEFGYLRKNLHKLTQLSPKIRICFRCNMKHSEECFITYPNTSKCVKKTRLHLVFSTHFSVFGYVMKLFFMFHILHHMLEFDITRMQILSFESIFNFFEKQQNPIIHVSLYQKFPTYQDFCNRYTVYM